MPSPNTKFSIPPGTTCDVTRTTVCPWMGICAGSTLFMQGFTKKRGALRLEDLRRYENLDSRSQDLLPSGLFDTVFIDKLEAVLLFMKEHLDELATLSTATLGPLLDKLLEHPRNLLVHHSLLIRLEKLLAKRLEAGEEAVRPLMGRIKQILQNLARVEKKTPKTRKRKR